MKQIRLFLVLFVCCFMMTGCIKQKKLILEKDELAFEYGENVDVQVKDLLPASTSEDMLADVKMNINFEDSKENKFTSVGTYEGELTYKNETKKFKVVIKDTTAPEFICFEDKVTVNMDNSQIDILSHFQASDLSEFYLTFDDSRIDLSKPGEYPITIIAKDVYGNQSEKKSVVVLKQSELVDEVIDFKQQISEQYGCNMKVAFALHVSDQYTETNDTREEVFRKVYNGEQIYKKDGQQFIAGLVGPHHSTLNSDGVCEIQTGE